MSLNLQPMKWSDVTHIDDIKPIGETDHAVFSEIKDVLKRHNALDRFGMFLVHKHFELSENEYVLEETDEENRLQTLSVVEGNDPEKDTIQTMWRFAEEGAELVTVCELRCDYFLGHKQKHVKVGR
ncbi:hypothetical protein [Lentilitoribacter sp. EG35]|uniref:hypothetical protein n=1 Tax=Lentilitoribacter sp. EG35 TaxID=3234192 RepID=UPI003461052A